MKKLICFVLLSLGIISHAQTTTVSATVVDTDGTTWANGSWSVTFVPNLSNPNVGAYNINSTPLSSSVLYQNGLMDGSGALSFSIYQTAPITPVGSSWNLKVCPNSITACGTYNFTSIGSTMSLSSALTSIIPAPRFQAVANSFGYADIEAQIQARPGSTYYNVLTSAQKCYSGSSWSNCYTGGIVTIPVTIATGGTSATTAAAALSNLQGISSVLTTPQTMAGDLLVPSLGLSGGSGGQTLLQGATGVNGQRLSWQAQTATGSAEMQLVPGASCSGLCSQIQFFNKTGANYERFDITAVNNQFIMDSTYMGTGTSRNIYFQMGGTVGNGVLYPTGTEIPGQNSFESVSDASIFLNGAAFTAYGKSWGANRTTIADWPDTGDSRLIIDTRTGTPSSVATDDSAVEYRRGGTRKWLVGLNPSGDNSDSYDWVNAASGAVLRFTQAGDLKFSSNIVLPNILTGYHGSSGVKVQLSDGTGTSGSVCFASDGSTTTCVANIQITTGTTLIAANTCTTNTATTMTGLLTTSAIIPPTPTTSTAAVTGWGAVGGLGFTYYPTANTFNWSVCNPTAGSITPGGSVTWNVGAN
jgi:hypothetical protein